MISFSEYITEEKIKRVKFNSGPANYKKGWWLEKDVITFFHGTHEKNLAFIEKNGIVAPTEGSTAGWVSLALEPSTAHGYAAMSGAGGETSFRSAGAKVQNVPHNERITFVVKIPKKEVLAKMAPERGAMQSTKGRLTDEQNYLDAKKKGMSDVEYYALTEIRWPKVVPTKYIVGYMYLKGK